MYLERRRICYILAASRFRKINKRWVLFISIAQCQVVNINFAARDHDKVLVRRRAQYRLLN